MTKTIVFLFGLFFFCVDAQAQFEISAATGLVFNQYNDVRVPNEDVVQGSLFSLSDDFGGQDPVPFIRFSLAYTIAKRHTIEATAVPLTLQYKSFKNDLLSFAGTTFQGDGIDGSYKFNTYRLSYRYMLVNRDNFKVGLGVTGLVRDAKIRVFQGDLEASDTDLGFVPLISFELKYAATDRFWFLVEGDALVGTRGRAEDVFAGFSYGLVQDFLHLDVGYRLIEGGADVAQVYNFAYFHFINVGLRVTL